MHKVLPDTPIILDRWGRNINRTTIGPMEEGDDVIVSCRVVGGEFVPSLSHSFSLSHSHHIDLRLLLSTSSFQGNCVTTATNSNSSNNKDKLWKVNMSFHLLRLSTCHNKKLLSHYYLVLLVLLFG